MREGDVNHEQTSYLGDLPGTFVRPELAERCADFLADVKKTILRRQQVGLLPEAGERADAADEPPPPAT